MTTSQNNEPDQEEHEYTCNICNKKYKNKTDLKRHNENVHMNKTVYISKRRKCQHCEKRFNKEETYDKHMKNEHNGTQNTNASIELNSNYPIAKVTFQRNLRSNKKKHSQTDLNIN